MPRDRLPDHARPPAQSRARAAARALLRRDGAAGEAAAAALLLAAGHAPREATAIVAELLARLARIAGRAVARWPD